jgi:endonuclease/exonuclease/phosphatase family metal-dependent hydrolase
MVPKSGSLRVMTFNLRYAHREPPDLWPDRRPVVREIVQRWSPDVVGTQEGEYHQLLDMGLDLPAYDWLGLGREGGSQGEFMAIFYLRDRFVPIEFDHFWLSSTPRVIGSRTWGNRDPRMVTWARFRDAQLGGEFYVLNTHLDHEVEESRQRSAERIGFGSLPAAARPRRAVLTFKHKLG